MESWGLGVALLGLAVCIWAYWSQKARIEIEKEKTKQMELQAKIDQDGRGGDAGEHGA
jgi:hypothetical protein